VVSSKNDVIFRPPLVIDGQLFIVKIVNIFHRYTTIRGRPVKVYYQLRRDAIVNALQIMGNIPLLDGLAGNDEIEESNDRRHHGDRNREVIPPTSESR
jgi:hypothetical protein